MLDRIRFAGLFGLCAALLLSGGCLNYGTKAEKDKLALIQPGVTSRAMIEQSFGPPEAVDTMEGHTVLLYSHMKAGLGLLGIAGAMDYDRQSYQFVLNRNGQVESYVLKEYHGSTAVFDGTAKETLIVPAAPTTAPH